jgi:ABC-type xylose transport system permease subunit
MASEIAETQGSRARPVRRAISCQSSARIRLVLRADRHHGLLPGRDRRHCSAPVNITNLLLQNSYIIIMALGMLLVIVAGHIDLSVGSVVGFIGALAAVMMVNWEWSIYLTIPACLLVGILIGAAQGYWIAYWKHPSFIVTLAGMLVFRGASLWLLEGQSVGPFPRNSRRFRRGSFRISCRS